MFDVDISINNLKGLDDYVRYVNDLLSIKENKHFQKYLQNRFLETVNETAYERIGFDTTQDLNDINLYLSSNKIQEESDGFILYNDAKIPADKYNILPFDTSSYPDGQFSLALAFEYGTGITAAGTYKSGNGKSFQAWNYSSTGWYLPKNVYGESHIWTKGYKGFEIYRFTLEKIKDRMPEWVTEYFTKYGGVS